MRQFPDGWPRLCVNNPHLWLLTFCGGVVSLRYFEQLPPLPLSVAALLILLAAGIRLEWLRPVAAFALGFCWANIVATSVFNTTLPAVLEKKDVTISGRVIGIPTATGGYQRFDFNVERLEWRGTAYPSPGKIRLKLYQDEPNILSAQKWRFTARLKQARSYQNPGSSFNYETYLFHHRLRATGYVRTNPAPVLLKPQNAYSLAAFRARVAGFIRTSLQPSDRAGIVAALVVGIRNDINGHNWEVLQRTGTIHLMAISGLHIGLVSGLVLLVCSWCWRFAGSLPLTMPAPKVGVMAGLLAGLVYALLAGMTIPTQRAVCMLAVVATAMFFQRRPFGGETLIMALATVLAVDPIAPLNGGLWLSFGAVTVLILGVARARANHSPGANVGWRMAHKLGAWSAIQMLLFIGMAPLLLVLFHRVSISAPLANLIAIPVIGLIAVPVALLGLLLYAVGLEQAAALAFSGSLWFIDLLWGLLEWLSAAAWSVWQQPSPPLWRLPLAAVGVLLLLSPRAFPARWTGLLWLLPLFATSSFTTSSFTTSPGTPDAPAPGEFRYTMLEVGHGLASVVQTRNHLLVYDAGPRYTGGMDAGKIVLVPFLRQLGVTAVDILIISHGDNDHIGGHRALLEQFDAGRILTSVPAKIPASQKCESGQNWAWDGVTFEMLSPPPQYSRDGNDASCVLKVSSGFGSVLLTGDIGKPAETMLVQSGLDLSVDVLQAPHHGSSTSSTGVFLSQVRPAIVLASIGYLNRYGHPNRSVRERYARRRIPVYNTADEGAISVSFSAGGIVVQGHRGANRAYWLHLPKQLNSSIRIDSRR